MNAPYITNIKEDDPRISVLCPNNHFLTSTHTADITYDHLPPDTKSAHLFRKLASGSLLSIGQLCDSSCEAFFNATTLLIRFQNKIVLTGTCKTGGLWYVDPPDTKNQLDTDETFLAFHPSVNSTVTFPAFTYCANVLVPRGLLKERIQFCNAVFGFPAISTFFCLRF